jgi:hypothetical protein
MSNSNLDRSTQPDALSRIGGAAQGGSAKPKEERDRLDREHGEEVDEQPPTGAGGSSKGTVGGNSNDSRTDQERSADKE